MVGDPTKRMNVTIAIADGFFKDPMKLRECALGNDFNVAPEFQGHNYKGAVPVVDPDVIREIETGLGAVHQGKKCVVSLAFFRMSLEGEDTPAWIHPDSSCDSHAAVIYLTRPRFCFGGTAFWRHRELGWDALPQGPELEEEGVVLTDEFMSGLHQDSGDIDKWEMTGLAQMKYNRLVTFRSNLFHSRWPKDPFGTNYDNGRLILGCFYSIHDAPSQSI